MATATIVRDIPIGQTEHLYVGTLALDSSYASGGEVINPSGNEKFEIVVCTHSGGYSFNWDQANQKLVAYYSDYDAGADGPLIQVPDTTDLSALTAVPFIAVGA